jgi:hypothetical protein
MLETCGCRSFGQVIMKICWDNGNITGTRQLNYFPEQAWWSRATPNTSEEGMQRCIIYWNRKQYYSRLWGADLQLHTGYHCQDSRRRLQDSRIHILHILCQQFSARLGWQQGKNLTIRYEDGSNASLLLLWQLWASCCKCCVATRKRTTSRLSNSLSNQDFLPRWSECSTLSSFVQDA